MRRRRAAAGDLGEHEDLALLVDELVEQAVEGLQGPALSELGVGQRRSGRLGEGRGPFGAQAQRVTVAAGDVRGDAMQPGAHRGLAAKLGAPTVEDQEHLLGGILDAGRRDPEATDERVDEAEVLAIGIDDPLRVGACATWGLGAHASTVR